MTTTAVGAGAASPSAHDQLWFDLCGRLSVGANVAGATPLQSAPLWALVGGFLARELPPQKATRNDGANGRKGLKSHDAPPQHMGVQNWPYGAKVRRAELAPGANSCVQGIGSRGQFSARIEADPALPFAATTPSQPLRPGRGLDCDRPAPHAPARRQRSGPEGVDGCAAGQRQVPDGAAAAAARPRATGDGLAAPSCADRRGAAANSALRWRG
jgi:hypothetical protein